MNPAFWQQLAPQPEIAPTVDSRKRLRMLSAVFVICWMAILGRGAQLEWRHGQAFRAEALKPLRRETVLPAMRGRILARDGTALAVDERLLALAVHYRYLQPTCDDAWLRNQARLRLSKSDRRDQVRVDGEIKKLRAELSDLNNRLATLCGLPPEAWQARASRIENRVETIAANVNQRHWERFENTLLAPADEPAMRAPWWNVAANLPDALRALGSPEEAAWETVIVKEQVDYHIVFENLPARVADEIRGHADQFPGVRVIEVPRRAYPGGTLAANVLGHLAKVGSVGLSPRNVGAAKSTSDAFVGILGLERVCQSSLAGEQGNAIEHTDRRGQLITTLPMQPAQNGYDVRLTLDPRCQQAAESLLDRTLLRNRHARGGAIVVIDVRNGEILALASAPRFDPNAFALGDSDAITRTLADSSRPMFDRATRMALPPGALVKPFVSVAMLSSNRVPAQAPFQCEGFLRDTGGLRCAIYRQQGIGHGSVTLTGALACNCNLFFAHYADALGGQSLLQAAQQFGFGSATGIELNESSGTLPRAALPDGPLADFGPGEAQLLALGQGVITTTPLQMARAMAAIASGRLLTPRLIVEASSTDSGIEVASTRTLSLVRDALRRAVADGAAHDALSIDSVAVAGLTSSGEVAGERPDHAWSAGYLPAEAPRLAFAIAIEHGGDGAKVAGPIAKRLLQRLVQLDLWSDRVAHKTADSPR